MTNINRDYLVILDVKSGELSGSTQMYFYNTDKNTSNIYVQLVVRETPVNATPIENATNYIVEAKIVKPGPVTKDLTATLVNESEAIYEFDLPNDCTNLSGSYKIEFWVKAKVANKDELITSSKAKYKVKKSILSDLDEAIEDSTDYPLLLQLMEEVRVINDTAHELDTTIRTLQADMIDANEEMKVNEEQRKTNEVVRQTNEATRISQESARQEYLNTFNGKWEDYKTNTTNDITNYKESINTDISDFKSTTSNDIANYKAQINAQEVIRETNEEQRKANESTRVTNENDRIYKENRRESQERDRVSNEYDRQNAEQSREYAEMDRVANEEVRQTNEANREAAEEIRKANEQARITAENARVTEHEQMRTELNEVKAENAILMENDKKQADRMTQVEISDKRQYVIMEGLMNSAGDGYLKIEDTGNDTTLYNSVEGFVDVKNVTGNTMVNSIKNPDDELTLNADINTSGQSVTLTTAVDNGQVDVLAEGNTMVNVCDQQEAVAITKSYTVESGNHVALQGEFDGKARPVVTGNTLVNCITTDVGFLSYTADGTAQRDWYNIIAKPNTIYTAIANVTKNTINNKFALIGWNVTSDNTQVLIPNGFTGTFVQSFTTKNSDVPNPWSTDLWQENTTGEIVIDSFILLEGDYTNKPIPDYFTGMQSSFEDKVVTQEMVDSGKESVENLGKYRVDYKVTGKNKLYYIANYIKDSIYIAQEGLSVTIENDGSFTLNGEIANNRDIYLMGMWNKSKPLIKKGEYTFSANISNYPASRCELYLINENNSMINSVTTTQGSISGICDKDITAVMVRVYPGTYENVNFKIQIEEGSTATAYEPYKESIKTYYLNSPLLEGDTIEESDGNVYHVHRYSKKQLNTISNWYKSDKYFYNNPISNAPNTKDVPLFCDIIPKAHYQVLDSQTSYGIAMIGNFRVNLSNMNVSNNTVDEFKAWLNTNNPTVIYQLASPTKELISQSDTILTDSYVAGHLDFDTAVPVERVKFNGFGTMVKYLYPSTEYVVQFESDNIGKLTYIGLNWKTYCNNTNVVKGINKFRLAIENTINSNFLELNGIGFNASNIVVTEATDKDFGYFAGMKSVGELEENKIEILSRNKNLFTETGSVSGYLEKDYGKINPSSVSNTTDFIPVKSNTYYTLNCENYDSKQRLYIIYDKNKQIIKHGDTNNIIGTSNKINIPTGGKYIRLTYYINATNYQLKEGSSATDYVPHADNKKQILLNEPLRAVGDTKDRFVQIDGKWYVERNCAEVVLDGSSDEKWNHEQTNEYTSRFFMRLINLPNIANKFEMISDNILYKFMYLLDEEGMFGDWGGIYIRVNNSKLGTPNVSTLKTWLQNNPVTVTYVLASPTYEPVEIAPVLNTYTDVTHITNNSTIPMNMPIVNSGYELIAKPSTKYTVVGIDSGRIGDSTIVNGTITTPATITDNFLRPYGTGKTSKVMLLEGEPANIPGYFKGIKSVFEDKVTEDGKYAVEVKVVGKNKLNPADIVYGYVNTTMVIDNNSISYIMKCKPNTTYTVQATNNNEKRIGLFTDYPVNETITTRTLWDNDCTTFTTNSNEHWLVFYVLNRKELGVVCNIQIEEGTVATEYEPYHETKQTLYLDEPLYNTNNITIYNDKLGYWKNWDSVTLDGSDGEGWKTMTTNNGSNRFACSAPNNMVHPIQDTRSATIMSNLLPTSANDNWNNNEGICTHLSGLIVIYKKLINDIDKFKQYLSQNPVTVVYQLKEPVFVPLIDNCPNWIIGSWDNCSIHFDSIIPLKDTRYRYTGNVPSVMTMSEDVATVSDISDQQDSMIIDLATQVATMEMMLM